MNRDILKTIIAIKEKGINNTIFPNRLVKKCNQCNHQLLPLGYIISFSESTTGWILRRLFKGMGSFILSGFSNTRNNKPVKYPTVNIIFLTAILYCSHS